MGSVIIYTIISLAYYIFYLISRLRLRVKIVSLNMFSITFLVQNLIVFWQFFHGDNASQYFSLFTADSIRYLNEITLFNNPLNINELQGKYSDPASPYHTTPKLGLPSYIATIFFFMRDISPELSYYGLISTSFFLNCIKINLLNKLILSTVQRYFLFLFIVLFPTDLYWSFRFLREIIVNDVLEIFFLYIFLPRQKVDLRLITILLVTLLIWRSQLALLALPLLIIYLRLNFVLIFYFTALLLLTANQILLASGLSGLAFIGVPLWIQTVLKVFQVGIGSEVLLLVLVFIALIKPNVNTATGLRRFSSFNIALITYCLLFLIAFTLSSQIRFWYPTFIIAKLILAIWLVYSFSRFKDGKLTRN